MKKSHAKQFIGMFIGACIWAGGVIFMMAGIGAQSMAAAFLGLLEMVGGYGLIVYNFYER